MNSLIECLTVSLVLASSVSASTSDRDFYRTDFSGFTVGENQLVGTEGWTGTNVSEGVHGIDDGFVDGQGQTAYLGANVPADDTSLVSLDRVMDESATGVVRFQCVLGITESVGPGTDVFSFGFFNDDGELIGAIRFDTTLLDFGVWTDDGSEATHTGEDYLSDFIHTLTATIDLRANVWSADLDGIPLFEAISFTSSDAARSIAGVTVEWEIQDPTDPGDNWLLFDDLSLSVIGETTEQPQENRSALHIERMADGTTQLSWEAQPLGRYQIEHSEDGITWQRDLLDQELVPDGYSGVLNFIDTTSVSVAQRLYRIITL